MKSYHFSVYLFTNGKSSHYGFVCFVCIPYEYRFARITQYLIENGDPNHLHQFSFGLYGICGRYIKRFLLHVMKDAGRYKLVFGIHAMTKCVHF